MNQKFKGTELKRSRIIARLLHWRKLNEEKKGGEFYVDAGIFSENLAKKYSLEKIQVAGIIAALSPQQAWDVNQKQTVQYLREGKANGTTKERLSKCDRIKEAKTENEILAILGGEKTKNFFLNIYGNFGEVCIDRHALACAILPPSEIESLPDSFRRLTKKQYSFFSDCYKLAAHKIGEDAATFQAIVWNSVREKRGLRKHTEIAPF